MKPKEGIDIGSFAENSVTVVIKCGDELYVKGAMLENTVEETMRRVERLYRAVDRTIKEFGIRTEK